MTRREPPARIQSAADWVAQFSGTLTFLGLNALLWTVWFTTGGASKDPYPFPFLTLFLSLEAIVLTTLVLFNQLRNEKRDKAQAELDREKASADLAVDEKALALLEELMKRSSPRSIPRKAKP